MAQNVKDSFIDLERHRISLEQNVAKLRKSLQHWQEWEIEYESMREDILNLSDDPDSNDLEQLATNIEEPTVPGQDILLTTEDRRHLLQDDKGHSRGKPQILGLLSHRIDYAQKSVKTVSSLLEAAEEKFAASQVLIQPEVRNEEGLPLTEIFEELDDTGNVISSSTSKPGNAAPQLAEALRKAGVNEFSEDKGPAEVSQNPFKDTTATNRKEIVPKECNASGLHDQSPGATTSVSTASSKNGRVKAPSKSRKSVSFTEDTKEGDTSALQNARGSFKATQLRQMKTKTPARQIVKGERVTNGKAPRTLSFDRKEEQPFDPRIPKDESPEDAVLREEMIRYNMREVGSIVAELDLDEDEDGENSSDFESGEDRLDIDGDEQEEEEEEDEEEDQFGRASRRVLTDDYVTEMRKLQERLKNIGPMTANSGSHILARDTKHEDASQPQKPSAGKNVRFASELDIQEAPVKAPTKTPPGTSTAKNERDVNQKPIHTSVVIERPYDVTSSSEPKEPDEFDPNLIQREVATQYHRMRNHFDQKHGGPMRREEEDEKGEVPLTEAEGGPKKISRFKAARLARLGI
ncbi:hypothetical protein ACLMJK_006054 [Lecanora helva]